AARFLGKLDSLGTIEKGKLADLVLVEANPLEKIENTKLIAGVITNGRYFSKDALQKLLNANSTN
ncbi:MAG TPA: amidohydrolase family protein, partial [Blastocatellia bacterium]|nr:amidohydrolase family protein [Blastocatellia bacterium]